MARFHISLQRRFRSRRRTLGDRVSAVHLARGSSRCRTPLALWRMRTLGVELLDGSAELLGRLAGADELWSLIRFLARPADELFDRPSHLGFVSAEREHDVLRDRLRPTTGDAEDR